MKFALRVLIPALLVAISISLLTAVPTAFAKENVAHGSIPAVNPELTLSFQPKIGDVLLPIKLSLKQNGTISVEATASWAIDTPCRSD